MLHRSTRRSSWASPTVWTSALMRHTRKCGSCCQALWLACTPCWMSTLGYPLWSTWRQVCCLDGAGTGLGGFVLSGFASLEHTLLCGPAGIVPIAHNSGGPRMDIIVEDMGACGAACSGRVGYLCSTEEEYAQAITEVLAMDQIDRLQVAAAARKCAAHLHPRQATIRLYDSVTRTLRGTAPPAGELQHSQTTASEKISWPLCTFPACSSSDGLPCSGEVCGVAAHPSIAAC